MKNIKTLWNFITPYLFTIFIGIIFLFVEAAAYRQLRNPIKSYIFEFIILALITTVLIVIQKDYSDCGCLLLITGVPIIFMIVLTLFKVLFTSGSRLNNNSIFLISIGWFSINIICLIFRLFKKDMLIKNFNKFKKVSIPIFWIIYIYGLFYALFYKNLNYRIRKINMVPFVNTIIPYLNGTSKANFYISYSNLSANILLFLPLGFFLSVAVYKSKRKIARTFSLVIILLVSVSIEILQYVFELGVSDIDDVILNVLGGIMGIFLFYIINKLDTCGFLNKRHIQS